jgi:ribosomal protein S18 acetylase RimI-like enzyme
MKSQFNTGRVLIRPASAADQATLVEFRLAMFADMAARRPRAEAVSPTDPAAVREANERWLDEHFGRDFISWIAELDGRPVASAGLLWFAHPPGPVNPGGREAYILNVYTRPEARRMGLAGALMERLVEEARAAGVRRIWSAPARRGGHCMRPWAFEPGTTWS